VIHVNASARVGSGFAGGIVPKEKKKAPLVTLGVVAVWLLALAFGVAFWAVLFYVAFPR
jgi:hypothetical protein